MQKLLFLMLLLSAPAGLAFTLPVMPPKTDSKGFLMVYDACTNSWISPGIKERAHPEFTQPSIRRPVILDKSYDVDGRTMRLHEVDIYHIEDHINAAGTEMPKSLRGIWWMDGNPVPEVVLSLADATYDESTGLLTNTYNGQDAYLVSNTAIGRVYWNLTKFLKAKIVMRVAEGTDLESPKYGDIFYVEQDLRFFGYLQSDKWPTYFIREGHWRRDTNGHCYNLRQIVDENGQKLPMYDYFVAKVKADALEHPHIKANTLLQVRALED